MRKFPNILTIAGSDSGGGAGIQADLKTMTALKGFGLSAITALTAQNGAGVLGIMPVPPDFILLQLKALLDGFEVHAAKTGMLCNAGIMKALVPVLEKRSFPLVVDPVCVSQSGHRLVEAEALETLRECIVPLADLLTPNLPEAEVLSGVEIKTLADVEEAMQKLRLMGAKAVLLKGGHFNPGDVGSDEEGLTDWLCGPDGQMVSMRHQRVNTTNNHGTGCTLSSAIATHLGLGFGLEESVRRAQSFLLRSLEHAFAPGVGCGPVNFMAGAGY